MSRIIYTKKGQEITVDDEDYEELNKHDWSAHKQGGTYYARRCTSVKNKKTTIRMHRVVMGAKQGSEIDHINGNGLDNRRSNLLVCTKQEHNFFH